MNLVRDGPLALLGLDARSEALYRAVLRHGTAGEDRLQARLEWDPAEIDQRLGELQEAGLVARRAGAVSAVAPQRALGRVIDRIAAELRGTEWRLQQLRAAIPDFVAEERGGSATIEVRAIEVYNSAEVGAALEALVRSTSGEMLFMHPEDWLDVPGPSKINDLLATEIAGGRQCRSIYPLSVLDQPDHLALVQACAEAGEEVRLLAEPPGRLAVFGTDATIMPVEWGGGPGPRVVARAKGVVAAVRGLFDEVWQRGIPLAASLPSTPLEDSGRTAVLRMLAAGAKDEAIARRLGVSLRTVRRRISDIMDDLGAGTRFAAGAEAARRGWL